MSLEDEVKQLKKEVEELRLANDVIFTESLRRRLLQNTIFAGVISTSLTDINETTSGSIPAGGGNYSVTHAEAFDKKVRITIDGADYWLGLYLT